MKTHYEITVGKTTSMDIYDDGTAKQLILDGKDMRALAKSCAKRPAKWMLRLFEITKKAMCHKKGNLVIIDRKKLKKQLPWLKKVEVMGCCEGNVCYVVGSDGGRKKTREAIIHEALHFILGGHPWPHEKIEGEDQK